MLLVLDNRTGAFLHAGVLCKNETSQQIKKNMIRECTLLAIAVGAVAVACMVCMII